MGNLEKETLELFVKFLIKQHSFTQYMRGIPESGIQENARDLISAGLPSWADTTEGDMFWRDLHKKWQKYLKKNSKVAFKCDEKVALGPTLLRKTRENLETVDRNASLSTIQKAIASMINDKDKSRHHMMTLLTEEVGELATVILREKPQHIAEELGDILLITISMANKFKVKIDEALANSIEKIK